LIDRLNLVQHQLRWAQQPKADTYCEPFLQRTSMQGSHPAENNASSLLDPDSFPSARQGVTGRPTPNPIWTVLFEQSAKINMQRGIRFVAGGIDCVDEVKNRSIERRFEELWTLRCSTTCIHNTDLVINVSQVRTHLMNLK
jgi:hypothetical protein